MAIYSLILQLQTRGTISVTWKKTALPVLVCLGLLTLFCSCNSYPDDSLYQAILETDNNASPLVEHYYPAGIPRTVSEMPETAAVIVRGTFLDDAQGEITYLDEVLDLGRGAAPGERTHRRPPHLKSPRLSRGTCKWATKSKFRSLIMWTTKTAWKPSNGHRDALNFTRLLSRGRNICSFSTIHSTKERKLEYTSLFGMNSAGIRLFIP